MIRRLALALLLTCAPRLALADPQGGGPGGAPGPAANTSFLDGCVYNAATIAPTTGQQMGLQCNGAGSLNVIGTVSADPCSYAAKITADFESTSSGGSIITAVSGKKAYICSVAIVTSAAANVSLIEGTGSSVCTGGTTSGVYLNTGTTAGNGASFAANGGVRDGGGGQTIAQNATANQNVCVAFTTTNNPQVNVHVSYVQQ